MSRSIIQIAPQGLVQIGLGLKPCGLDEFAGQSHGINYIVLGIVRLAGKNLDKVAVLIGLGLNHLGHPGQKALGQS